MTVDGGAAEECPGRAPEVRPRPTWAEWAEQQWDQWQTRAEVAEARLADMQGLADWCVDKGDAIRSVGVMIQRRLDQTQVVPSEVHPLAASIDRALAKYLPPHAVIAAREDIVNNIEDKFGPITVERLSGGDRHPLYSESDVLVSKPKTRIVSEWSAER